MVLNDKWIKKNSWMFEPFDERMVNPASIDLRWSGRVRRETVPDLVMKGEDIDSWRKEPGMWDEVEVYEKFYLAPQQLYLLDTLETVQIPPWVCGIIMLKSSIGRYGLEHLHAGFFDPGFGYENPSTATLEIFNASNHHIGIKKEQPIIQMVFLKMENEPEYDYRKTGRYNGQISPQEAK